MDLQELRQKLRRAGLRPAVEVAPPTARSAQGHTPNPVVPDNSENARSQAEEYETPLGVTYCIRTRYWLPYRHGLGNLASVLDAPMTVARDLARHTQEVPAHKLGFLDTETTGLAGGAGTLAFMVGLGVFTPPVSSSAPAEYTLYQYFLRKPGEERAMLTHLTGLLAECEGIVTYNGRTFDIPLLESRYTLARQRSPFSRLLHLDLLAPARRLWRGRTENCSLGTLEREILALPRTGEDVPGWLIPQLYVQYLQSGDTSQMERVLYHNRLDILSLTALTGHVLFAFGDTTHARLSGEDCLRLANWLAENGSVAQAEATYRAALERPLPQAAYLQALQRYAAFLKGQNRRAEAVEFWELWAAYDLTQAEPFEELSKYYEWHSNDIAQALVWAEAGLGGSERLPKGWAKEMQKEAFTKRITRLRAKLAN